MQFTLLDPAFRQIATDLKSLLTTFTQSLGHAGRLFISNQSAVDKKTALGSSRHAVEVGQATQIVLQR